MPTSLGRNDVVRSREAWWWARTRLQCPTSTVTCREMGVATERAFGLLNSLHRTPEKADYVEQPNGWAGEAWLRVSPRLHFCQSPPHDELKSLRAALAAGPADGGPGADMIRSAPGRARAP